MVKLYSLFLLLLSNICFAQRNGLTVFDLIEVGEVSLKQADNILEKKGFVKADNRRDADEAPLTYFEKINRKGRKDSILATRTVELFKEGEYQCIKFQTCSKDEFTECFSSLRSKDFVWDSMLNPSSVSDHVFRKGNVVVETSEAKEDGLDVFTIMVKRKEFPHPADIHNAEDLLCFDSHEYLLAYFGEGNVTKDVFYFSEEELRKCSVLFPNTSRQAVFIWENERTMSGISFILISGLLPTLSAVEYSGNISQNTWKLRSGIHTGMRLKDLVQLNGNDFNFFGNTSEFFLMVEPVNTGSLNFSKTGVMLSCFDNASPMLKKELVSALETVEKGLPLYVAYLMVSR